MTSHGHGGSVSSEASRLAKAENKTKMATSSPVKADNALVESDGDATSNGGQVVTELPQGRQLGMISATFLMINRIVGTRVFATTSTILAQSGAVGMSLLYWVIGAIIAFAGFYVYAEFATAIPRNGGELNYLQHVYRKPRYFVASMYAAQALLLGQAAGNANAAGQYFMRAGGQRQSMGCAINRCWCPRCRLSCS